MSLCLEVRLRVPFIRSRLLTATAAAALGPAWPRPRSPARRLPWPDGLQRGQRPGIHLPLNIVGQVNFSSLAKSEHRTRVAAQRQGAPISKAAASSGSFRVVDSAIAARRPKGTPKNNPNPATAGLTTQNVPGENGFSAMGDIQQASTVGGSTSSLRTRACARAAAM